jgi:integrase
MPGAFGSPEFRLAYSKALAAHEAGKQPTGYTLAWLIEQYLASPAWSSTAKETRKQFKYQFARMRERAAKAPLNELNAASIAAGRDARAGKPSDANKYLKASVKLFAFAVERGWMKQNPAKGIAKVKTEGQGFHTWTEDEVAAYEARWPLGTRERLALDLLLYTGVRRGDVVRLGRQHARNGEIVIRTEKSVNSGKPVEVTITILPPLARSIEAGPTGPLQFLMTAKGKPFGKESFGNWFRLACRAAGVPGSPHGLRKIAAVRCAENGATEIELNAMFGWADGSNESATYVRNASRAKMGRRGSVKMLPHMEAKKDRDAI